MRKAKQNITKVFALVLAFILAFSPMQVLADNNDFEWNGEVLDFTDRLYGNNFVSDEELAEINARATANLPIITVGEQIGLLLEGTAGQASFEVTVTRPLTNNFANETYEQPDLSFDDEDYDADLENDYVLEDDNIAEEKTEDNNDENLDEKTNENKDYQDEFDLEKETYDESSTYINNFDLSSIGTSFGGGIILPELQTQNISPISLESSVIGVELVNIFAGLQPFGVLSENILTYTIIVGTSPFTPAGRHPVSVELDGAISDVFYVEVLPLSDSNVLASWSVPTTGTNVGREGVANTVRQIGNGLVLNPTGGMQIASPLNAGGHFANFRHVVDSELRDPTTFGNLGINYNSLNAQSNNAWWEVRVSSLGHENIEISWRMRGSATGPRDIQVQYRTNESSSWANAGQVNQAAVVDITSNEALFSVVLPETANNQQTLYIRLLLASNTAINGNNIAVAGTFTLNDIVVREAVETATPAISTIAEANAMPVGSIVTIEGFVAGQTQAAGGAVNHFEIFVRDGNNPNDGIAIVQGGSISSYVGTWVRITGTRANFQTQGNALNISAGNIEAIEARPALEPVEITLYDLQPAPAAGYRFMNISLDRVQILERNSNGAAGPGGAATNAVIVGTPGGSRIELRAVDGSPLPSEAEVGTWISIGSAHVTWFNARSAIQLVNATGITVTAAPSVYPVVANVPSGMISTQNFEVQLSTQTTNAVINYRINGETWQNARPNPTTVNMSFPTGETVAILEVTATYDGFTTTPVTFTYTRLHIDPIRNAVFASSGTFTVEGYVIGTLGASGNDARNMFLMDGTGRNDGIVLWPGTAAPEANTLGLVGRRVRVTGTRGANSPQGIPQLNITMANIIDLGSAENIPVAPVTRTSDLVHPNYRAMRVSLNNVQFHRFADGLPSNLSGAMPPAGTHFILCPDGTRIEIRLEEGQELPETGAWINITEASVGNWAARNATQLLNAVVEAGTPPPITTVAATPASDSVIQAGAEITLSTVAGDGLIRFQINNGEWQISDSYTVTVTLPEEAFLNAEPFTANISAYAVLPPYDNGWYMETIVREFTFTHAQAAQVTSTLVSGTVRDGAIGMFFTTTQDADIFYTIVRNTDIGGGTELEKTLFNEDYGFEVSASMLPMTVIVVAEAEGFRTSEPLILEFEHRITGGERIFFGQMHSHTIMSDGRGTPEEAFREARDIAGLDFFVLSDHSNSFNWGHRADGTLAAAGDSPEIFNLFDYQIDRWELNNAHTPTSGGANYQWERSRAAARAASRPDFIASVGFEFTWSGGPGHMNTFNTTGWVSRNNAYLNNADRDLRLTRYYELLRRTPQSVSMFNHPGTTFGNFHNFAHFDPITAQRIPLIEVSNGEGVIGTGGFFPSHEQFTLALDRGWLLAPANSQDNHRGLFGHSNEARVAVYTNDFTYDGLWAAFRERAAYATEIRDMEIRFYVDNAPMDSNLSGFPMGSILHHVPSTAFFGANILVPENSRVLPGSRVPVRDDYTITRVSLVTNGGIEIESQNFSAAPGEMVEYRSNIQNPEAGYYFLRVIAINSRGQERIAMTAPIWLGRAPIVGISDVSTTTLMPVTTEEIKIEAQLFNDENFPVVVREVEFRINGVSHFVPQNLTILPGDSPVVTFGYTPQTPGTRDVVVRAVIDIGESTRFYYGFMDTFLVRDINSLYFVGIDGSHMNDYVTGSNADSFSNFARMAAGMNFATVIFQTEAELIAATTNPLFKVLILSPPGRGSGFAARQSNYSQEVVEAVAAFARRGGTVAISGYGNFNDQGGVLPGIEGTQMWNQNRILSAMGSHIRIGDVSHTAPLGFRGPWTHQHNLRFSENMYLGNEFMRGVIPAELDPNGHPLVTGPVNTNIVEFDLQGGQFFRNFSTGALFTVNNSGLIAPRNQAEVNAYVTFGELAPTVSPMIFAHPASHAVDSNSAQGAGRTKFPAPNQFPRYAHPVYGLAPAPQTGTGVGQRPAAGGTAAGQILIGASETVGAGSVLVFSSIFFTDFDVRPELDNPLELHNINYTIIRNMLEPLAPATTLTTISEARTLPQGTWVTVEGTVTSALQTQGDNNTGFMNSLYIQDATGGINLFEITEGNAMGVEVGNRVRAFGFVSSYQGEVQLTVHLGGSFRIIDAGVTVVNPRLMNINEAKLPQNIGRLVEVRGFVSEIITQGENNLVLQFTLSNNNNEIPVYMRGYITPGTELRLQEGDFVSVIGLASHGELAYEYGHRIRVRDRSEITQMTPPPEPPSGGGNNNNGTGTTPEPPPTSGSAPSTQPSEPTVVVSEVVPELEETVEPVTKEENHEAILSQLDNEDIGQVTITLPENVNDVLLYAKSIETLLDAGLPLVIENGVVSITIPLDLLEEILGEESKSFTISIVIGNAEISDEYDNNQAREVLISKEISILRDGYEVSDTETPVVLNIDLSDFEIEDLNPARIILTIDSEIIGGTLDTETGLFTISTILQAGIFEIVYVPGLRRVNLQVASNDIFDTVYGNSVVMDVLPQTIDGRTTVPVRFITEILGGNVSWNSDTRTVTIVIDGETLHLVLNETIPGMDVPATTYNGRTMVPLRFVSEYFGATVNYTSGTGEIEIIK